MFKKILLGTLLSLLISFGAISCSPKSTEGPIKGTSSGGGGYSEEAGLKILEYSKNELIKELKNANPALEKRYSSEFFSLIIDVLERLNVKDTSQIVRDDSKLLFNYDIKTKSIFPTSQYFDSLSHLNLYTSLKGSGIEEQLIYSAIANTKLRLLHEITHLIGFGTTKETDYQSRSLALEILQAMSSNFVLCTLDEDNIPKDTKWRGAIKDKTQVRIIHRPTLKGLRLKTRETPNVHGGKQIEGLVNIMNIFSQNPSEIFNLRKDSWFADYSNRMYFSDLENVEYWASDWQQVSVKGDQTIIQRADLTTSEPFECSSYIQGCGENYAYVEEEVLTMKTGKPEDRNAIVNGTLTYNIYTVLKDKLPKDRNGESTTIELDYMPYVFSGILGQTIRDVKVSESDKNLVYSEDIKLNCMEYVY